MSASNDRVREGEKGRARAKESEKEKEEKAEANFIIKGGGGGNALEREVYSAGKGKGRVQDGTMTWGRGTVAKQAKTRGQRPRARVLSVVDQLNP